MQSPRNTNALACGSGRGDTEMRVWVFSVWKNERQLAPWFVRWYSTFAERIIIFDDGSDDGTKEFLRAQPKVTVHDIAMGGIDENGLLDLAYANYPSARGKADYVMWVDADEFIYHPRMLEYLAGCKARGWRALRTLGFNMMSQPLPEDDGISQLTDIYRTGLRAPVYSKPVVFDPAIDIKWDRGKHRVISGADLPPPLREYEPEDRLRLLHFRYLTPEYTRERNARQFDRCGLDKGAAWSNSPSHTGEHSYIWVAATQHLARDVVCDSACYLPGKLDA